MKTEEAIVIAASFLRKKGISFVNPGKAIARPDNSIEVVFAIPESFDPDVVVDPPDIWVLVDPVSGAATLVPIM